MLFSFHKKIKSNPASPGLLLLCSDEVFHLDYIHHICSCLMLPSVSCLVIKGNYCNICSPFLLTNIALLLKVCNMRPAYFCKTRFIKLIMKLKLPFEHEGDFPPAHKYRNSVHQLQMLLLLLRGVLVSNVGTYNLVSHGQLMHR